MYIQTYNGTASIQHSLTEFECETALRLANPEHPLGSVWMTQGADFKAGECFHIGSKRRKIFVVRQRKANGFCFPAGTFAHPPWSTRRFELLAFRFSRVAFRLAPVFCQKSCIPIFDRLSIASLFEPLASCSRLVTDFLGLRFGILKCDPVGAGVVAPSSFESRRAWNEDRNLIVLVTTAGGITDLEKRTQGQKK